MRIGIATAVVVGALALGAAPAWGDGSPVPGVAEGGEGVQAGGLRYVTMPAGNRTQVAEIDRATGAVTHFRSVAGYWGIPLVTYTGTTSGIAPGLALVLAQPYPWTVSRFLVLDPVTLRVRRRLAIRGIYGFDAISPDGRFMYLIQHRIAVGFADYTVRAYDLARGRLLRRIVVDRRLHTERMSGIPMARAQSADGVWAYTLYQKPDGAVFVHALDTETRTAHCIDLPGRIDGASRLRLQDGGRRLVWWSGAVATSIETRTLALVRAPQRPRASPPPPVAEPGGQPLARWWPAALAAALVAAAAARYAVASWRATSRG